MTQTRRVIIGEQSGVSGVISDDTVEMTPLPGGRFGSVWRYDSTPDVPNDGRFSAEVQFAPPGGTWVLMWELEAGQTAAAGGDSEAAEAAGVGDKPGRHRADSVDVNVVIAGELTVELADDSQLTLRPGELVVVNGDVHSWHNRGTETVRVISTSVGARRI